MASDGHFPVHIQKVDDLRLKIEDVWWAKLTFDLFTTAIDIEPHVKALQLKVGRVTHSALQTVSYYEYRQGGCGKKFRVVKFHDDSGDDDLDQYFMKEVIGQDHRHDGLDVALRGLSKAKKTIVLQCDSRRLGAPKRVIEEFERLVRIQIETNAPAFISTARYSERSLNFPNFPT